MGSGSGSGSLESECVSDEQCTLAAATCCECPSFATGIADPVFDSCAEVECPVLECATNVTAACLEHRCVI
ncbi:MAG: hypothetical protein H0T79_01830, partial [Deltaproteobacteria bacterium]|nr:hypothetical protein [Deltaproteobacteria bacterium]